MQNLDLDDPPFPYPIHPEVNGLLPWGSAEDSWDFFWVNHISFLGNNHMRIQIRPPKATDFFVGMRVIGTVTNRVEFGLFLDVKYELHWGIDGVLLFSRTPTPEVAHACVVGHRIEAVVTKWEIDRIRLEVALPAKPSWLTAQVMGLALSIWTDRTFDLMPILGDALEEAGCLDKLVLNHCRSATPLDESWLLPLLFGAAAPSPR